MSEQYISSIDAIDVNDGTVKNYKIKDTEARSGISDTKDSKTTFISSDSGDSSATAWTSVDALSSTETHASIFAKISQMFKNIRFLYNRLLVQNEVTLSALNWTLDGTTYTQSITINGVTASSNPIYQYNGDPSVDQYKQYCYITALITTNNTVTFRCNKNCPTIDLPILIRGI